MICFPNAKINLGLHVVEKRTDGFHNIESLFYPVPFQETLEFVESKTHTGNLRVSGLVIDGQKESNLVWKAYQYFKSEYGIPPLDIYLDKQIPMGAGLGGGSADLGFFTRNLNELFQLGLSVSFLENLVATWSSDAPFFIQNKPAVVMGKGELVQPVGLDLKGVHLVIVNPGVHVATPKAYGLITPNKRPLDTEVFTLDLLQWNGRVCNDFEEPVMGHFPELRTVKKDLQDAGLDFVQMSGSGSSFFGLGKSEIDLEVLKGKYPHVHQVQL